MKRQEEYKSLVCSHFAGLNKEMSEVIAYVFLRLYILFLLPTTKGPLI